MSLSEEELRQADQYDAVAAVYDDHYHGKYAIEYRSRIFDGLIGHLDFQGRHALDSMCGGGANSAYLRGRGAIVSAFDLSGEQCRIYGARYPDADLRQCSALELPFSDETFDLVVYESLHHLHPEVQKGLQEAVRVLKPGGYLLAWEPVAGSLADVARKVWYQLEGKPQNEKALRVRDLAHPALELTSVRYGGNVAYLTVFSSMHLGMPQRLVSRYAPVAIAIEDALNRVQPRFLSCWFLALLRKRR